MVGGVWSEDMSLQLEATTLGSIERFITEWSSGSIPCLLFHGLIMLVVSWIEWSSGKKSLLFFKSWLWLSCCGIWLKDILYG
ncbi:hypothetical protein YC2023_103207 [Brassica napus]